jgi:SNF2 family DNA or RNA helicase
MLDDMTREFQEAKEQDGLAITRVIDNIKEGECQVCRLPLEEFDTFIVRCCGLIVCDECGIKGNQIQKRYDYKLKSTTICGSCANCKATIYPQTDLLFVDRNFDMEALLKAKGDEEPAEAIEEVVEVNDTKEPEIKNPKLKALLAIVRGQTPDECESIPISIQHLIAGRVDMPGEQTHNARKVVVFANFNETLNLIEEFLIEHGVTFLRLGGTFQEKANTVKKFMTFGQVLLINSSQHCAGLNIQFMTDLVFFHKIMDKNIEAQVAGRGQRIGRTCNLRIHYICYKNEKDKV